MSRFEGLSPAWGQPGKSLLRQRRGTGILRPYATTRETQGGWRGKCHCQKRGQEDTVFFPQVRTSGRQRATPSSRLSELGKHFPRCTHLNPRPGRWEPPGRGLCGPRPQRVKKNK